MSPTPDSPFRQSFTYNAFNQKASETGRIWQREMAGQLFSFTPLEFSAMASLVLMTTLPFLGAALIIHWLWIKPLQRIVPSWLMIALLGSLLFNQIKAAAHFHVLVFSVFYDPGA